MSDPFLEKGLPSSVEAERAILGAILLDNAVCVEAGRLLKRDDFFLEAHRRIFDKMISLSEHGAPIDLVTLSDELSRAGEFEQIGGATYIGSLITDAVRLDRVVYYAKIVREKAARRKLIQASNQTIARVFDEEELGSVIKATLTEFDEIRERGSVDSIPEPFFIHAKDLYQIEPAEVVPGTHFIRNGLNVIFGPSEAGKTFYQIARSIEVSRRERVIYLPGEGAGGLDARIKAYCSHHRLEFGDLYFHLQRWSLLDTLCIDNFIQRAEREFGSIAMVVVDTLARALVGGDENSAKDVGLAIANATAIQKALRCAVVVIHHTNRAERGERGSGALRGAADVMLEVTNDDGLITVSCSKLKDGPRFDPEYFRLVPSGDSAVLLPANVVVVDHDELTAQQMKILSALALEVFQNSGAKHSQISEITKLPESSLYRSLSTLKSAGFLSQGAKGDPYFITEIGRERWRLETDKLSRTNGHAKPLTKSGVSTELSDSQLTLNALSESASPYSPHSHTPLGVRVESSGERGDEGAVEQGPIEPHQRGEVRIEEGAL